ncbi:MAG: hypothetical protein OSJ66_00460 [Clostridia bacterium]|nr:hypothetical protein [Clostridia bacterium]
MKEYSIMIICNGGKPYLNGVYNSVYACLNSLEIMVNLERERRRPYFVDLEYFNNDYDSYISGKYFKIVEREVTEWKKYKESTFKENSKSKIIKIY